MSYFLWNPCVQRGATVSGVCEMAFAATPVSPSAVTWCDSAACKVPRSRQLWGGSQSVSIHCGSISHVRTFSGSMTGVLLCRLNILSFSISQRVDSSIPIYRGILRKLFVRKSAQQLYLCLPSHKEESPVIIRT